MESQTKEQRLAFPHSAEELYAFALHHGFEAVCEMLKSWVELGQPEEFLPGYGSRAKCAVASAALEGTPLADAPAYLESKYGPALYRFMWYGTTV